MKLTKLQSLFLEILSLLIGYGLLIWINWKLAIAIFLIHISINFDHSDRRIELIKSLIKKEII